MRYIFNIVVVFVLLISCSEDLDFEAPEYKKKVVVDGWIEGNGIPHVILTFSSPFLTEIDSSSIFEFVATRAKVTVDRGDFSDILTLKPNDSYFPNYVYETSLIRGQTNKTYQLIIEVDNQVITSETTIPPPPQIDSVWFEKEQDPDTLYTLMVKIDDDPEQKNYYRFLTKVKNVDANFVPAYFANLDDKYFNGEKFEYPVYKGNENILLRNDFIHFAKGDSVFLKIYSMDEASFNFWSTFSTEIYNVGNPFTESKSPIQSNVDGGLGIWAGYGTRNFLVVAR